MSIFNEMQSGGYNEVLVRRFALQGASASPALVPEVAAGLIIENDRPEWGYLMGENLFSGQIQLAAGGAGTNATVALTNPASSGLLVVVKKIWGSGTGNLALHLVRRGAPGPTLNFVRYGIARDGRFAGASSAGLYSQNAAAVTQIPQLVHPLATIAELAFILRPGDTLAAWNVTTATAFTCSLEWSERQAAPGELV